MFSDEITQTLASEEHCCGASVQRHFCGDIRVCRCPGVGCCDICFSDFHAEQVIRLHFQQYKLQEANSELKDHQKARLELQEQADRTERDAMTENENTAKRSKEIIEKILLVENFIQDLHVKRKHKEEVWICFMGCIVCHQE